MAGSRLRNRATFVILAVAGLSPSTFAAWLCDEPATAVATLIKYESGSQGSVHDRRSSSSFVIEGIYKEAPWTDGFIVVDAADDKSSITVQTTVSPGAFDVQSGDVVRIRGSVMTDSSQPCSLAVSLEASEASPAVAVCSDVLTSFSARRLAQSSGRKKVTRRRKSRGSAKKKKPRSKKKAPRKKKAPSKKKKSVKKKGSTQKKKSSTKKTPSAGNTWKSVKNLPLSMGEVSAGVLKEGSTSYLVVVGQHPRGDQKDGVTMIFDLSKQVWYEATARPEVGNHHASEVINNKLYLFGGLSGGEGDVQIGTLVNTQTGIDMTWAKGAGLPFDGGSAATALIDGKVYYCGGINKSNTNTVSNCAIYDPSKDTWTEDSKKAPNMPKGRNHAAACSDGKKLYVFGGRSGKNIVGPGFADTQILEPGKGWTTGKSLPLARGGMGKAVHHNGKCYVFGGEVAPEVKVSTANKIETTRTVYRVDVYDISSNSWSLAKDMPDGLHGMFPVKHNGKVYVAAGGTEAAYSQSMLHFEYTL